MCMIDGCERSRVQRSNERKARKAHRCDECSREIAAGEQYEYTSGIDSEDYAFSYKMCAHCRAAALWLSINCGGYVMQGVQEDLEEHAGEYMRPDVGELAAGIRCKWYGRPIPALPPPLKLGDARVG